MVYVVSCFVSYCFVCSGFEEFLWDVAAPSSVEGYAGFEDFLGSRRVTERTRNAYYTGMTNVSK